MQRTKLKATKISGGFSLQLIGDDDRDLGVVANCLESLDVEMEDGSTLPLYEALVVMIQSRVTGFVVLTEPAQRHGEEWLQ